MLQNVPKSCLAVWPKSVSFCRIGKPASTVCEPCPFDENNPGEQYYMDEGPHFHPACKKAIEICPDEFLETKGSNRVLRVRGPIDSARIKGSREKAAR